MKREARPLLVLSLMLLASCSVLLAPSRAAEINGNLTLHGALNGCTTGGTGAAYTCAPSPSIGSYRTGTLYSFVANVANTGTVSINFNALGAKTIKKVIAGVVTDLSANDILAGMPVTVIYDGTFLRMVSPNGLATQTIASGTTALATAQILSGACATVQTATATGALTTDAVIATFSGNVTGVTGYTAATTGSLRVDTFLTANTMNFVVCNATAAPITPGAVSVNWRIVR